MPLYEYECLKCGERFELIQKFSDAPLTVCSQNGGSQCDGAVRKLLSAPAIQFKGSG
ncbi:MAG: zinc ribbon domain-containing protein, partial [Bryobacterales bacterium]|nr:zinc ribbon domain-containing protein [Bryobacterales bacterium]